MGREEKAVLSEVSIGGRARKKLAAKQEEERLDTKRTKRK